MIDRRQKAQHRFLDFVDHLVDDRVEADIHFFLLGSCGRIALGPDVEAQHDSVRSRSQQNVGFVDRADAGAQHTHRYLLGGKLFERIAQHFSRTADVGLENEREFVYFARRHLAMQLFERQTPSLSQLEVRAPSRRGT